MFKNPWVALITAAIVTCVVTAAISLVVSELIAMLVNHLNSQRVRVILTRAGVPDVDNLIHRLDKGRPPIAEALAQIRMGNHVNAWTTYLNEAMRRDGSGNLRRVLIDAD